jgi:hypothetical protein
MGLGQSAIDVESPEYSRSSLRRSVLATREKSSTNKGTTKRPYVGIDPDYVLIQGTSAPIQIPNNRSQCGEDGSPLRFPSRGDGLPSGSPFTDDAVGTLTMMSSIRHEQNKKSQKNNTRQAAKRRRRRRRRMKSKRF